MARSRGAPVALWHCIYHELRVARRVSLAMQICHARTHGPHGDWGKDADEGFLPEDLPEDLRLLPRLPMSQAVHTFTHLLALLHWLYI